MKRVNKFLSSLIVVLQLVYAFSLVLVNFPVLAVYKDNVFLVRVNENKLEIRVEQLNKQKFKYSLAYYTKENNVEGVSGMVEETEASDNLTRRVDLKTCSAQNCINHNPLRIVLKTQIAQDPVVTRYYRITSNSLELLPNINLKGTSFDLQENDEKWLKEGTDPKPTALPEISPITEEIDLEIEEENKEYSLSEGVKIKFTSLPKNYLLGIKTGDKKPKLKYKKINLKEDEKRKLGAISDIAYEITSNLNNENDKFKYDLTLPLPTGHDADGVKIQYASSLEDLLTNGGKDLKNTKISDGKIIAEGVDHFTIFVLSQTPTVQPTTGAGVYINEVDFRTTSGEWVEIYNANSSDVDLSGWKLELDDDDVAKFSQFLTIPSGTVIPAKGYYVFKSKTGTESGVPVGWNNDFLLNTKDVIVLRNPAGEIVDKIIYEDKGSATIVGEVNLGTFNPGDTIARITDGNATLVKRTGDNVTKGFSNNLKGGVIQGLTFIDIKDNGLLLAADGDYPVNIKDGFTVRLYDESWNKLSELTTKASSGPTTPTEAQYLFEDLELNKTYRVCGVVNGAYVGANLPVGKSPVQTDGTAIPSSYASATSVANNSNDKTNESPTCWETTLTDTKKVGSWLGVGFIPAAPIQTGYNINNGAGDTGASPRNPNEIACTGGFTNSSSVSVHWTDVANGNTKIKYQRQYSGNGSFWSGNEIYINPYTNFRSFGLGEVIHYSRVRAFLDDNNNNVLDDNESYSAWSNICSITYDKTSPTKPTLLGYKDPNIACGGTTSTKNITTDWSDSTDKNIDGYEYEMDYPKADGTRGRWSTYINAPTSQYTGSLNEGIHYVRVRAKDKAGNYSAWTSDWNNPLTDTQKSESCSITYKPTHNLKVCKQNQYGNPVKDWQFAIMGDLVKTSSVDVTNAAGTKISGLTDGENYIVVASGKYNYGNTQQIADAGYNQRAGTLEWWNGYERVDTGETNYGLNLRINDICEVSTDNCFKDNPKSGNVYWGPQKADNKYYSLYSHTSGDAKFSIRDDIYTDNESENFKVEIYRAKVATTGADGCATFADLESGSYKVLDVLQPYSSIISDPLGGSSQSVNLSVPNMDDSYTFKNNIRGTTPVIDPIMTIEVNDPTSCGQPLTGTATTDTGTIVSIKVTLSDADTGENIVNFVNKSATIKTGAGTDKVTWELPLVGLPNGNYVATTTATTNTGATKVNDHAFSIKDCLGTNPDMETQNVTVCKEDDKGNRLSGWEMNLRRDGKVIEFKDSYLNKAEGYSIEMPAGWYEITASGTYNYGNGNLPADAGYSKRNPNESHAALIRKCSDSWSHCLSGYEIVTTRYSDNGLSLRINDDGSSDRSGLIYWGDYNDSHRYTISYYHPGGPMKLSVRDNVYSDNKNIDMKVSIKSIEMKQNTEDTSFVPSSVSVPSSNTAKNSNQIVQSIPLESGTYTLKATGTYTYINGRYADAAFSQRNGVVCSIPGQEWVYGANLCNGNPAPYDERYNNYLNIRVAKSEAGLITTGQYLTNWSPADSYSTNHEYTMNVTITDADVAAGRNLLYFTILDSYYGDNSGSLNVEISKNNSPSESGCTTFENVPYGEYFLSETVQSGWEVVIDPTDSGKINVNKDNTRYIFVNRKSIVSTITQAPTVTPTPTPTPTSTPTPTVEVGALKIMATTEASDYGVGDIPVVDSKFTVKVALVNNSDTTVFNPVIQEWVAVPGAVADDTTKTINSSINGNVGTSICVDPNNNCGNHHSPAKWAFKKIAPGETITVSYKVNLPSDIMPGTYRTVAWAQGNLLGRTIRANGINSDFNSNNFVGDSIQIVKNIQSTGFVDVVKNQEKVNGQVLGISSTNTGGQVLGTSILPATGASTWQTILATVLTGLGIMLMLSSFIFVIPTKHNKKRKLVKKLKDALLGLIILLTLTSSTQASETLSVRLSEPRSPANLNNFKLGFVALGTNSENINVQCYKKGPNDNDYLPFGPIIDLGLGNSGYCEVNSSVLSANGNYKFRVKANTISESSWSNEIVSYDYNTDGPATPVSYSRHRDGCYNKINFKTANDGKTMKVELYRSENTSFGLNEGSKVASMSIGPNNEGFFENTVSDCNKSYYYVIRAFDQYGNGSGTIGDSEIKIINNSSTTGTSSNGSPASSSTSESQTGAITNQIRAISTNNNANIQTRIDTTSRAEPIVGVNSNDKDIETKIQGNEERKQEEKVSEKEDKGEIKGASDVFEKSAGRENNSFNNAVLTSIVVFLVVAAIGIVIFLSKSRRSF